MKPDETMSHSQQQRKSILPAIAIFIIALTTMFDINNECVND